MYISHLVVIEKNENLSIDLEHVIMEIIVTLHVEEMADRKALLCCHVIRIIALYQSKATEMYPGGIIP